jgi:hypothetical protein
MAMVELRAYLEEQRFPSNLKSAAKNAYLYYLQRRPALGERGLFDELPRELRYKLINSTFQREIQRVEFLRNCDMQFLSLIIVHCKPYECKAGEIIYNVGDIAEELSFVVRGKCIHVEISVYIDIHLCIYLYEFNRLHYYVR